MVNFNKYLNNSEASRRIKKKILEEENNFMPSWKEAHPSKYIKAVDFAGKKVKATIAKVEWEQVDTKKPLMPVVYFVGKNTQGFVPNASCCEAIERLTGQEDPEYWAGAQVVLTTELITKGTYKGKLMFVIELPDELKPEVKEETWGDGSPVDDSDTPF